MDADRLEEKIKLDEIEKKIDSITYCLRVLHSFLFCQVLPYPYTLQKEIRPYL